MCTCYFLRGRTQVTKVGCHISNRVSLTSGIVQGTCLGPLMFFLIYVNDLVAVFDANVTPKLYADDLKLYASLSCLTSIANFQKNLDRLTEWAKTWQLAISVSKCCITQVGSKQGPRDMSSHQFVLCNSILPYVDAVIMLSLIHI